MTRPEPDREFIELKEAFGLKKEIHKQEYHISTTRTTFVKFNKLSYWDNTKMIFFDGTIPYTFQFMVALKPSDIDHLIKMLQSVRKEFD